MQINSSSVIHHPLERVYRAYRDELPQIAAYMPNVKGVEVAARTERDGSVDLHNVWTGKGEIPKVAQGVVKPDMLKWDDYASWTDATTSCRWTLGLHVFRDSFHCEGSTRLEADGPNRTRVTLSGTLEVSVKDIPGVPRFLASTIAPAVERFIIALVTPNLEETNRALERYLDARA